MARQLMIMRARSQFSLRPSKIALGNLTLNPCVSTFPSYFRSQVDFDSLTTPFTHAEIDDVVKEMPADRAPGPDGFNGAFLKVCWPIIRTDFYQLCEEFHSGKLNLESLNYGFITLIPKKNAPETVNDYRPITLLNCCLKMVTKILADRLQKIILQIVHRNQYGFLRGR